MNIHRWRQILLPFATGQGALQILQILSGFTLVRYMDVHDYGIAAFLIGVQSSGSVLSDIGLRNGVIANLGRDSSNYTMLGRLVRAAFYLRSLNMSLVSAGVFAAFWIFHIRQGLPASVALSLAAATILNIYVTSWTTYFSLPWLLSHDMKNYYKPQVLFQALRFVLIVLLALSTTLDVIALAAVNLLTALAIGWWCRQKAAAFIKLPAKPEAGDVAQLRKFIYPLAPAEIFWALQDQIPVFLLAITGGTANLAQVFALGRISTVFQFFGIATTTLAIPWIARTSPQELPKRYLIVFGSACLLAGAVLLGSIVAPDVYLWILGDQYRNLYLELWLSLGGMSALFLYGVLYHINNARMWIWGWSGAAYATIVVGVQLACILSLDMSQTRNVLLMTLLVGVGVLLLQFLHTLLGFWFRTQIASEAAAAEDRN